MEKAKLFRSPLQEREAKLVAGVSRKDVGMQSKLYDYCKRYFWTNYRGLFFISENDAVEIFQNSFITLWENIERGKIMACDGIVVGKKRRAAQRQHSHLFYGHCQEQIQGMG